MTGHQLRGLIATLIIMAILEFKFIYLLLLSIITCCGEFLAWVEWMHT